MDLQLDKPLADNIDAFLSYSRADFDDVKHIYEQLISRSRGGLSLFMDQRDITYGQDWLMALSDYLSRCEVFLFFVRDAPHGWQMQELLAAIQSQTERERPFIIPVLLPNVKKNAFLGNPSLTFIHRAQAAQFRQSCDEIDVIDGIINAVQGNSRVYISSRTLPRNDQLPSGFQADLPRLTKLLIGDSVYKSRDICIRELIQNANDACVRLVASSDGNFRQPEVIVAIDDQNRFFDVIDFGDGMTAEVLLNSFSVLGRSLNDEFHINSELQSPDSPVTGKFGVGFVSTFMIADEVFISTKSTQEKAYHIKIQDPTEAFIYTEASECSRWSAEQGTTVRVVMSPDYAHGSKRLDVAKLVRFFCRHVPALSIANGRDKIRIDSGWNYDDNLPVNVTEKQNDYEIRISWAKGPFDSIKLSNGGFYVMDLGFEQLGDFPRGLVSGEINVAPGFVDVNLARDSTVANEKVARLRNILGSSIGKLVNKTVTILDDSISAGTSSEQGSELAMLARRAAVIMRSQQKNGKIGDIDLSSADCKGLHKAALVAYVSAEAAKTGSKGANDIKSALLEKKLRIAYGDRTFHDYNISERWDENHVDATKYFPENKIFRDHIYVHAQSITIQLDKTRVDLKEGQMMNDIDLSMADTKTIFDDTWLRSMRIWRKSIYTWRRRLKIIFLILLAGTVETALVWWWLMRQ